jgi:hypothetical protein
MDDAIRLGYQAALVSLVSPTYGRLWLAVEHHPGDTVACTQAEALVQPKSGSAYGPAAERSCSTAGSPG